MLDRRLFTFSNLLERVRSEIPTDLQIFLVGGAVRDALLSRPTHDLDFVLSGDVLGFSRRLANRLGAAYYPLDVERGTARLILIHPQGAREVLDFALLRGPDLESDLRARDFTINAIALAVHDPQTLLDPLDGASDLRAGQIRACSPSAFQDDPVRILRAIRLAAAYRFRVLPETRAQMRQAVAELPRVSPERLRDEIFRILEGPKPATAIRALDLMGALPYILPELPALKGVRQSAPHLFDVWEHTLDIAQKLDLVLAGLAVQHDPEAAENLIMGQLSLRLGRYRQQIHEHLAAGLIPGRDLRAILFLAALFHDAGKPATQQVDESGRIRFYEHEQVSARIVSQRARFLKLSNDEIERLKTIVRHHMRPLLLAQSEGLPSRRAIYRFFRDTGPAGVDICLLTLADTLATYGPSLPQDTWAHHLDVVRALLEAWWERSEENISPPALVDGRFLIETYKLKPGPLIGKLLDIVREAQAAGEIDDRQAALKMIEEFLEKQDAP
jgi:poly(A) polymerase